MSATDDEVIKTTEKGNDPITSIKVSVMKEWNLKL